MLSKTFSFFSLTIAGKNDFYFKVLKEFFSLNCIPSRYRRRTLFADVFIPWGNLFLLWLSQLTNLKSLLKMISQESKDLLCFVVCN